MRDRIVDWIRDSGYLFVIATIPGLERITQYWFGNDEFLRGHSVSFWTTYALAGVTLILWIFAQRKARLTTRAYLVPILLTAVSLYTLARLIFDNQLFNLKALVLLLVMLLITIKPPRYDIARQASIVLGLFVILAAGLSLPSSVLVLVPTGFDPDALLRGRLLASIGVERWEGPFGNVNYAAIAGGMTALVAFLTHGPLRLLLGASGVLILALSQGRAATAGLIAGLLVLVFWSPRVQRSSSLRRFYISGLFAGLVIAGVLLLQQDPTLNGRVYVWRDYLALGTQAPVLGLGNPGLDTYVQEFAPQHVEVGGVLLQSIAHSHGHSIFIDQWARGGLVGLLLVIGAMIAIGFFSALKARCGSASALSFTAFVVVSGALETTVTWNYLTVLYSPLFIAWILSLEFRSSSGTNQALPISEVELIPQIHADPDSQESKKLPGGHVQR